MRTFSAQTKYLKSGQPLLNGFSTENPITDANIAVLMKCKKWRQANLVLEGYSVKRYTP